MTLEKCRECGNSISSKAVFCPKCGLPFKSIWRGFEWKSKSQVLGWPLIHIAIGRDSSTGKLLVAKGIIAIGQFGVGLITIAQFGIGILFGLGQFVAGLSAIGQFAFGVWIGIGQFATGITAIGQIAFGKYVLAQKGFGEFIWSIDRRDPLAVEYFKNLWVQIWGVP